MWNREGADAGIRTPDLLFTKQLLCQLSYVGGLADIEHLPITALF